MHIKTLLCTPALIGLLFALIGCSSQPSENDIREAIEKNLDESAMAAQSLGGKAAGDMARKSNKLNSAKKVGCKEDGEKAYRCDVEIDANTMIGPIKRTQNMRFVRGDSGWVVSQAQ